MLSDDSKDILAGLAVLMIGIWLINALFDAFDDDPVEDIRKGDKALYCEMSDGYRKIDGELVVDFQDGVWLFENGSAKNCEVK